MDRRLRNRIVILLLLACLAAPFLVWLSGRKPAAKISAMTQKQRLLNAYKQTQSFNFVVISECLQVK